MGGMSGLWLKLGAFYRSVGLPGVVGWIEICILAAFFYYALRFLQGTRGAQVLLGFVTAVVSLLLLTQLFHFNVLNWLLQHLSVYLVVAFIVIFQPEIRRALAELGKRPLASTSRETGIIDELVKGILRLAEDKIGALIAIEREIATKSVQETGTRLDAFVTAELLGTIFFPHTPLHDGGVIINGNRVTAAGCVFPLTSRDIGKMHGTRHRAAVGMSEETDALVLVVSEETGAISVAYKGRLIRSMDERRLRRILATVLLRGQKSQPGWRRVKESLDLSAEGLAHTIEQMESEDGGNAE